MPIFSHSQLDTPSVSKRSNVTHCRGSLRALRSSEHGVPLCESSYTFLVSEWTTDNARAEISLWAEDSDTDAPPTLWTDGERFSQYQSDGSWELDSPECSELVEFMRDLRDEILAGCDMLPELYES